MTVRPKTERPSILAIAALVISALGLFLNFSAASSEPWKALNDWKHGIEERLCRLEATAQKGNCK